MSRSWFNLMAIIPAAALACGLASCESADAPAVREMQITHVDPAAAADGAYRGEFAYGGFTYVVEVVIEDHEIADVFVLHNRDTYHSRRAEAVAERVLNAQSADVAAVTGATTTSKALLKAVERALRQAVDAQEDTG